MATTTTSTSGDTLELGIPEYCEARVIQTMNMPAKPHLQTEILNSFLPGESSGANIDVILDTEGLLELIRNLHEYNVADGGKYRSKPRIRALLVELMDNLYDAIRRRFVDMQGAMLPLAHSDVYNIAEIASRFAFTLFRFEEELQPGQPFPAMVNGQERGEVEGCFSVAQLREYKFINSLLPGVKFVPMSRQGFREAQIAYKSACTIWRVYKGDFEAYTAAAHTSSFERAVWRAVKRGEDPPAVSGGWADVVVD